MVRLVGLERHNCRSGLGWVHPVRNAYGMQAHEQGSAVDEVEVIEAP